LREIRIVELVPFVAHAMIVREFESGENRVGRHTLIGERLVIAAVEISFPIVLRSVDLHAHRGARKLESGGDVAVAVAGHGGGSGDVSGVGVGAPQVLQIEIRYRLLQRDERMPPVIARTQQPGLLAEISNEKNAAARVWVRLGQRGSDLQNRGYAAG